jgi:NADH dehydrogenase
MEKNHIVILGAGFGGLRAAMDISRALRRLSLLEKYDVVLIDRNDCHIFIPLLYKVAARPEPEHEGNCSYEIAMLVKNFPITFMQGEIISPDVAGGTIALKDGRAIRADYLVIALGSETNYFGIAGLREHALQLKTIESALQIRAAVSAAFAKSGDVRIVAGGGGPNGVELAAELREWATIEEKKNPGLHVSISIVEAMPTLLPGFAPNVIAIAMRRLKRLKISVMTGMKIASVTENEIMIAADPAKPGEATPVNIPFDVLIWTGGTKTPDLLSPVPLQKEPRGKPMAQNDMSCLPGTPDLKLAPMIYAVGDDVCFMDPKTKRPVPAVAHVAILEGEIAAHNVVEEIKKAETASYVPRNNSFVPQEYPYVIPIGESWAVAKLGPFIFSGWLGWEFSRLVEFNYLLMIMSPWKAFKAWMRM